ncbi:MAG: alpha/beta hydrolase [Ruthenibacterium lactatiformans]
MDETNQAAAAAAAGAGLRGWVLAGREQTPNEPSGANRQARRREDAADVRLRAALRAGARLSGQRAAEFWRMQSFDGLSLVAEYIPAAVPTPRTLLCIHGYTSTGRREFSPVARALREAGYNLILPDGRAHGQSEGEYVGFGATDQRDCLAWAYEAQRRIPRCELALYGISMGAATVLLAGAARPCPRVCAALWKTAATPAPRMSSAIRCAPWRMCRPGRFCRLPTVCRRKAGYDTARPMPWPPCGASACRCCSSTAKRMPLCPPGWAARCMKPAPRQSSFGWCRARATP